MTTDAVCRAAALAISESAKHAAELTLSGDLPGAERAIRRAEERLKELRERLPWHSALVRRSTEIIRMAHAAARAPKRAENEETGLVEPVRARRATRVARAALRTREAAR